MEISEIKAIAYQMQRNAEFTLPEWRGVEQFIERLEEAFPRVKEFDDIDPRQLSYDLPLDEGHG